METRHLGKTGFDVSPIGLGTVEIGIDGYGFAGSPFPSETEAINLLKSAVDLGITYIDTARGYGEAEARIGKSGIAKKDGVVIGTKAGQFLEKGEQVSPADMKQRITEEIETSLRLLKIDSLRLVQLHGGSAEQIKAGDIIAVMQDLKQQGKLQHFGIAVRGEEAALAAIESGAFATIQLAHSILDQRLTTNVLPQAEKAGIGIINRSVLLQGALTPKKDKLPEELKRLKDHADQAETLATSLDIGLPELAIRFALSNSSAISTALIGTTKASRLEEAIAAASKEPLEKTHLTFLRQLGIDEPHLVDPSLWPKT